MARLIYKDGTVEDRIFDRKQGATIVLPGFQPENYRLFDVVFVFDREKSDADAWPTYRETEWRPKEQMAE